MTNAPMGGDADHRTERPAPPIAVGAPDRTSGDAGIYVHEFGRR